jgi:prevent-host-death family protein
MGRRMANEAVERKNEGERIEVGSDEFRRDLTDLVNRASYAGARVIIHRHGKPIAALVGAADLERLDAPASAA